MSGVSFACPDWFDRLKDGRTPIPDLPLDPVLADCAVALFNKLRVPDIRGMPTMEEVAGEWMRDIVRAAFGSIDAVTGKRFVGEVFNLVPKKNGKTTNAAALGLIALMMNRRPNIDGMIVGPTQEVAQKCFEQASAMIAADEYLNRRFRVIEHKKTILDLHVDPETGVRMNAKLKIKSFDPKVVTGSIPAFAILDELHVMAHASFASRVIGQIRGGMITNEESLLIIITTQSEVPPFGVFKDELNYARGVRDGRITQDVRMLPILYEFPEAMQISRDKPWRDPANWPLVLPNLGRSVTVDRLRSEWNTAQEKGESSAREWASQHLNVQIGLALHSDRWIGADYWEAAADRRITLDYIKQNSDVVVVGGDVGGLEDLWGLAVLGRHKVTRHWMLWVKAWCQPIVLERHKEIAEKLRGFEADGDLVICDRVTQDAEEAAAIIVDLRDCGLLPNEGGIGLDPAGVPALLEELALYGVGSPCTASVSQGYRLSAAIFGTERKLADGTFKHCGSPLLLDCVGNVMAEARGQNIYLQKRSASAKIDPLMAGFNAVEMMSRNPDAAVAATSPWDDPNFSLLGSLNG
ncbi:phage terminase large subunit-like protein [Rhizobium sp. SG_E_25_P2]|uniref:terminase large subunit n=1 Tax=Rhizobium sp. SG_E_25_P2 TaxID=2879942 RepID=UPI002473D42F|nr:terminase large subunit [Rhizobium sp. SG_E_25_P2]MDH6265527.1 phage terminase large subunit-like protein [Rhizobium sp. SG_E_25_P2]